MLSANDKLGPYEILAPVGKGGMGEVYRARDSRVGREVAIKTSREQFSERFEREARAIAALNHPNICTLHDVGENYLVMEFVEGETLAERIKRGPIPLEESLHIARQIAAALEAAHEKGIVHRDLKPGNVILKPDGSLKVLDFGLAKQTASGAAANSEDSPTLSIAATQAGVILGTAAYMAPEQARGKSVDKRADIWAFGVVLYEMVTGQRLFRGDDLTDTLAAVVRDKPNLTAAPPQLRRLLEACLQKEPRQRLRDIADVWKLLDDPQAEKPPQPRSRAWIWPTAAAVLMTILAGVTLWAPWRPPAAAPEVMKLEISPPKGTTIGKFAVSPDGRKIAFFASGKDSRGLWVRSLSDVTPVRVGGNFDVAGIPSFFWSADNRFVAFSAGNPFNHLVFADSEGGASQTLVEIGASVVGGSWSPDGTVLFGSLTPGVFRVSASGGDPVQLTASELSRPATCHCSPILLPDGKHFLYFVLAPAGSSGIFVGSIDAEASEQSKERIVSTEFTAAFAPTPDPNIGILLFRRDDTLLAQKLDLRSFQLMGASTHIASGVAGEIEFGALSASKDVLAYHTGPALSGAQLNLTWSNLRGEDQEAIPGVGSLASGGMALSPDGSRAAVTRSDSNTAARDIWLLDFGRNNALSRLTSGPEPRLDPVWSSDGNQVAYVSIEKEGAALARRPSSGSGSEEVLLPSNGKERHLNDWSRDGRFLLFSEQSEKTKSDLWVVPLDGERKPELFLNSEFNETEGQFSPDGHWIAYVSDETGHPRVYIQPFPRGAGGVGKIPVSDDQGVMPRWRRDGKVLFYQQVTATMATEFTSTPAPRAGIPQVLFQSAVTFVDSQTFFWDVAPSGDRFLHTTFPLAPPSEAPLTVVINWQQLLEKTK